MSFRLFLLCSFVLLARPQDILTFLQPWRPALVLTVLATGAMVLGGRLKEILAVLSLAESKRYLLLFLIMIVGIPFAYYKRAAFEGVFLSYVPNVLFFILLVHQVTSLQRLKSFVWVICLSTLMYSVVGGALQSKDFYDGRFQAVGNMFDPNDTAYVLLALFPLCIYFVRFDEGVLKKLVAVVAACSAFVIILLTGSRGGILGLGSVLLILLLTNASGIRRSRKLLLVVMLASAFLLMRDRIDVERYLTLIDVSSDYNVSRVGGRVELWERAIDLVLDNPITGVGVNCFEVAVARSRELAADSYTRWQVVHNSYLQVVSEVGLIGGGLFLLIVLRSFLTFLRVSRIGAQSQSPETKEISALAGLMLLGFAGLLVSGFFLSQGYSTFFTLYFALAAAIGRIQAAIGFRSSTDESKGLESRTLSNPNGYPRQ